MSWLKRLPSWHALAASDPPGGGKLGNGYLSRVSRRLAVIVALVAISATTLMTGPAAALGNNRVVYRSCGTNWVASGGSDGHYWGETSKNSGDCSGRLSVAMQYYSGHRSARVYGTREAAYTNVWDSGIQYGLHWGCDSCNVTYS